MIADSTSSSHLETTPRLEVLRCPSCGADVAVSSGKTVACGHCATMVEIPLEHRELHRLMSADKSARARAEELFARLATPPWLATKYFAAVFDQPAMGFLFFYGTPVGLVSILEAIHLSGPIARAFHYAKADDVPFVITVNLIVVMVTLFALVPRVVGVYANRRARSRRDLIAGLAAAKPKLTGGPSACRSCGAPLEVLPNALVAQCLYCGAENAPHISEEFVSKTKRVVRGAMRSVEDAVTKDREERARTRRQLVDELIRYGSAALLFGVLFSVYAWDTERPVVKDNRDFPVYGVAALFASVIAFIVIVIRSGGGAEDKAARDERRDANGAPEWLRFVGPLGVWALLYVVTRLLGAYGR